MAMQSNCYVLLVVAEQAKKPRKGLGVAAATKERGKRGQRVAVVSSPMVVAKGQKGQGVAAATTKQLGWQCRDLCLSATPPK